MLVILNNITELTPKEIDNRSTVTTHCTIKIYSGIEEHILSKKGVKTSSSVWKVSQLISKYSLKPICKRYIEV